MTVTTASQSFAVHTARPITSAAAMITTVAEVAGADPIYADPLDDDETTDRVITTTCRAISRVALVASETASRFQREGLAHDPMTWMLAPRHLFGGASAIEACLDRDACMRGVLIHGLSLGLDADPDTLDALIDGEDVEDADGGRIAAAGAPPSPGRVAPEFEPPFGRPRLFTATVASSDGFETVQAFHASLAADESEVAARLYMRMGAAMADAVIIDGFDATMPLVTALVSAALCDTLELAAADPGSPLAAGLDVNIEQRFLN